MSKKFEPSSYDPTKDRTKRFEPRPQGFYASTQNPNQMLNYSFQTGEEFSLEFMQERVISRSQLLPKNNNANQIQPSPVMSSMAQRRSQSSAPTHKMNNLIPSKEIGRTNVVSGFSEHEQGISSSKQESSKKFLPSTLSYNFVQENIIKFFCNFGGKFLPRPSDGKIRYVGGETYILKLSKDITWNELVHKTMRLCNRTHTIKYQLPGESVHVLILVSCDEDVHHMIEECDVFEGGEEKPRLFLFSSEDEDDHSDVHFGMGSTDTDYETIFMAAVNGVSITRSMDMDRDPVNMKGSASGSLGDLDQLIFDLDSDSTSNANYSGGTTISTKRSPHKPIIQMASSVPAELKFNNKSKHAHAQKELGKLDGGTMELNFDNKTTGNVDNKLFSRKFTRQFSDKNLMPPRKVSSPRSSIEGTSFDDPFFMSNIVTSSFGYSKYEDDVNSLNYTNNMTDEPLPRPEDRSEPTNIAIYDSTESTSLHGKMLKNDDQFIETSGVDGSAGLVQYNRIPLNKSFNKQRKFGSHEDTKLDLIYGERPNGNILRQHTIERSDPDDSMRSKEINLNDIMWQDDTGVSFHSNSLVRKLTKEEFALKNLEFSQTKKKNSKNSRSKKEEFDLGSGSGEERRKASFEMDPVHQVYHTPTNNRSNSGRSEGGSLRVGHLSQDDRDSVKIPLFEHEEFENEGEDEPSLQKIDLLSRNFDLSNVQVISNDDLEDLRELGSGAFGTVYHGKWRGTDVAIKRIKNSCFTQQSSQTYKLVQEFCREAEILSKLHHPNVLAFYGVVNDGPGGSLATVTEFMVSGSLKRVLLRRDRYLDQRKRIILAMDASIGMEYLHAKGVVHFDLKCDNLLVNLKDPSRPICKVADFGLAKMKETTMVSMVSGGMRGTLPWMAPEQLSHTTNKVSEKIDVYSFGVVMWEILTCDDPYDGMHYGQVILGILSNTLRPPIPSSCDPDWRNLMERCWSADPSDRPSFTEIASCLRVMLDACQTRATN